MYAPMVTPPPAALQLGNDARDGAAGAAQPQRVLLLEGVGTNVQRRGRSNIVTYQIPVSDSWTKSNAPAGARVAITCFNRAPATTDGFGHTVGKLRAASVLSSSNSSTAANTTTTSSSSNNNIRRTDRQGSGAYGFVGGGGSSGSDTGGTAYSTPGGACGRPAVRSARQGSGVYGFAEEEEV
jgi:hypothetical protein